MIQIEATFSQQFERFDFCLGGRDGGGRGKKPCKWRESEEKPRFFTSVIIFKNNQDISWNTFAILMLQQPARSRSSLLKTNVPWHDVFWRGTTRHFLMRWRVSPLRRICGQNWVFCCLRVTSWCKEETYGWTAPLPIHKKTHTCIPLDKDIVCIS